MNRKRYVPIDLTLRETAILAVGAVLYAASMPGEHTSLGFFAYFALVPLFFCVWEVNNSWKAALFGLLFGTAASFVLLYWIKFTVSVYGKLGDFLGILSAFFLSLYCGLYTSAFSLITMKMAERFGISGFLGAPFIWSGIELLRTRTNIGFPWLLFGYSQYGDFFARQFAAFGGVIGTGFVLVLVNVLFFLSFRYLGSGNRKIGALSVSMALSVIVCLHLPGFFTDAGSRSKEEADDAVSISVVQPNIDQWKKWDEKFQGETIGVLEDLTEKQVTAGVDLVVWPETALPFFFYWDEGPTAEIKNFVQKVKKPIITGIPWYDGGDGGRYFNSIALLSPEGNIVTRYDKMKLVPFGEYVPFRKILFFVEKITEGAEDFSRGKGVKLLTWNGIRAIPSVCYEAIFPQLSVEGVMLGGNLLVNVTNDAWFGDTEAPHQQLNMAAFRSVETGRYMVRVSNSGITAVIDQFGIRKDTINLFVRDGFTARVRRLSGMTFYVKNAKFIDSFIISGSIILIIGTLIGRFKNGRNIRGKVSRDQG